MFQPLDFIKEIGIIQTLVFKYFSFFQPNVYNSWQMNNIDRFGTQIQGSFFLLLLPNEVVVLDYKKYRLFWLWFHLNTRFLKVTSIEYSRLSPAETQSHNTLQISNNILDGEILNTYIYRTPKRNTFNFYPHIKCYTSVKSYIPINSRQPIRQLSSA